MVVVTLYNSIEFTSLDGREVGMRRSFSPILFKGGCKGASTLPFEYFTVLNSDSIIDELQNLSISSPVAGVEQISITEEQQAAVRLQQMEEDKLLARRLQAEDDSDIGTCRSYRGGGQTCCRSASFVSEPKKMLILNNSCNCYERHVTVMLGLCIYTYILQLPATRVFHK